MKPRVMETIVVEGRYDKNSVMQAVDAAVIETGGFGIFSDAEKLRLIRRLAEKCGVIILTDSDGAGFVIRNYLKGSLGGLNVKHAYIPDVAGRERRKRTASKEGKLGVEGMGPDVLVDALIRAGATFDGGNEGRAPLEPITKADFYDRGLTGREGSAERRARLIKKLDLPEHISANALIDVLNVLMTRADFFKLTF